VEIHKPKPWHGFREFLKEYLIIVVGVLTALAFEQGVEWLHWRNQIAETEAALLPEVQVNLLNSYERMVDRVCLAQRIVELRDRLTQPGSAWKASVLFPADVRPGLDLDTMATGSSSIRGPGAMPSVYTAPLRPWGAGVWTAALSSGVVSHMARERALHYADFYRSVEQMRELQEGERAARTRLSALAFDHQFSEADKIQFLNVLGELNYANEGTANLGAQILKAADKDGWRVKASSARQRLAGILKSRGACYQPVVIPLAPG
jgi:hypothetical protein